LRRASARHGQEDAVDLLLQRNYPVPSVLEVR
jgi:hypothetical protein